jgi:hypothetical protein
MMVEYAYGSNPPYGLQTVDRVVDGVSRNEGATLSQRLSPKPSL